MMGFKDHDHIQTKEDLFIYASATPNGQGHLLPKTSQIPKGNRKGNRRYGALPPHPASIFQVIY